MSVFSYRSWLRGTKQSRFKGRKWTYKWVQSLRELDVFGLEDLDLDPKNPAPHRNLMLLSDDVECVMLSKQFYLRMAGPELRKKIYAQVTERNRTMTQVTNYDCSMIRRGGVTKDPDVMADPMQPIFCIHC
ncbi:hypothetical protein V1264_004099 [Littorina saxatilis]|uniref:Uncharacterized protein n=2 Tax=Littorina saxatilis TaxID=31220 RepID=A0AAN9G6T9_9CAEN